MFNRVRISVFLLIVIIFLGYNYFSWKKAETGTQHSSFIELRRHNLNNPKFINIPDFNKRGAEVEFVELKTFPKKLNINKERKEVLELLPMVGGRRAEEIVKYREKHGEFTTFEDLLNVPTINQAVVDNIKDYICFKGDE